MKIINILAIALIFVGCNNEEEKKETLRPVFFQKIVESDMIGKRSFAGVSQAENEANLSFKVGGTLEKLHYKLGEPIKKGSIIAHINSDDYEINYQKALASEKNSEIQVESAKSNYNRIEKLYANNNASLSDFEKVKAQYESAKTMLKTAQSQLKAARNQLDYTRLKAPFDGSISKVTAKENEMIGGGMPILVFSSVGNLEIKTQVPENVINRVEIGQIAKINFTAIPEKEYEGRVSEIGQSTSGTLTYPLIISISNKNDEILPGMACNIVLKFEQEKTTEKYIVIPSDAVAHDEGGDFVYILKKSGEQEIYTAIRKRVTLGKLTSVGYEIRDGLNRGEMIVTAGLSFMYDGRKVRLLEK